MKNRFMLTTALAATLAFAALSPLHADEGTSAQTDPGFRPGTGQINDGRPQQAPTASHEIINVPTPEETLAAKMTPISTQPSTGEQAQAGPVQPPATTGAASNEGAAGAGNEPPPSGPIGAVGQTIPAKFSKRNDVLDRTPIMAWPLPLDAEQRKQIFDAVMADKSPAVAGADALKPASELSTDQALNGMHALPDSVQGIDAVKKLKYVKAKDKVLLVEPSTRIVVDQLKS
jgi:hypothetical protein